MKTATRPMPLTVTVRLEGGAAWHACVRWGRRPVQQREFDSPLELARFLVRLTLPPPRSGGLR